ncbi:MAG: hypothetical protein OEZ39_02095 [Gammaproteobacteria bacterium]|nr:hypothetical protein [Gammaproteobacteria bacterium]MDH5650646.1 hypothetical protein [Gammaproteobacteria bacterium]
MKYMLCSILAFLFSTAHADTFKIGSRNLVYIPAPDGFSLVTSDMEMVNRMFKHLVVPGNEPLAYYIPNSQIASAKSGSMPTFTRYFMVTVDDSFKKPTIGVKDFAKVKEVYKIELNNIIKEVKEKVPAFYKKASEDISVEFGQNFEVNMIKMFPLELHRENINSLSYSMYMNLGGVDEPGYIGAVYTFTILNVSGKVVFLYCYGLKNDIEWTRSASKAWEDAILSGNNPAPQLSMNFDETKDSTDTMKQFWKDPVFRTLIIVFIFGLIRSAFKSSE